MTNFDLDALALTAYDLFMSSPRSVFSQNLNVVGNDFLTLHNDLTGQSRMVLLHIDSGFVFKNGAGWAGSTLPTTASRRYLCDVFFKDEPVTDWGGNTYESFVSGSYPVRLPEFYFFDVFGQTIEVSEYVDGGRCCAIQGGWCHHARSMCNSTRCPDAHNGNYVVTKDEVVLIDFDGIVL